MLGHIYSLLTSMFIPMYNAIDTADGGSADPANPSQPVVMSKEDLKKMLEDQATATADAMRKEFNLDKPKENSILDIKGGNLTLQEAPKQIKLIRFFKAQAEGDMVTVKALTEGSATDGGNLVPTEFATDLIVAIEKYGVARQDCSIEPMTSMTKDLRSVTTKPLIYQVSETVAPTEAAPKFGLPVLTAKAFAGSQVISKEEFTDNNVALYQRLVDLFGEGFAGREDQEVLDGTTFTGVLKSAANVITIDDPSIANITYKELVKIKRSLSQGKLAGGGKFYMHRTILSYIEGLTDTNGRPIVVNPFGASDTMLLGYPVVLNEQMPETDAAASPFIIFGNMKWTIFGDRQQIDSQVLKEATVNGVNLAAQRCYAIVMDERFAVVVAQPSYITVVKTHA
jgi:HK97 family phage major capsid protein